MKNKVYITGILLTAFLLISCATSSWKDIPFLGEDEPLLGETSWNIIVAYAPDGRKFWYFVDLKPNGQAIWSIARHSKSLSRNSTWERKGNNFIMTANNGGILFNGDITVNDDVVTITGILILYNGTVHKFEAQKHRF
jgi:hypothetical protein